MFQTSLLVMSSSAALAESSDSAVAMSAAAMSAPAMSGSSWLEAAEPGGESQVKLLAEILRPKQLLIMGIAARTSWCCAKLLNGQMLPQRARVTRVKLARIWCNKQNVLKRGLLQGEFLVWPPRSSF